MRRDGQRPIPVIGEGRRSSSLMGKFARLAGSMPSPAPGTVRKDAGAAVARRYPLHRPVVIGGREAPWLPLRAALPSCAPDQLTRSFPACCAGDPPATTSMRFPLSSSPSCPSLEPYGWNDHWRRLLADLGEDLQPGRVLRHNGSALQVITAHGATSVRLGPSLDPPPAVGDWVALDGDIPVAVLARTSLLRRRTAIADQEQPLVANVDVVLVVCGLDRPVKAGRIQRVATLARDAGAVPVIVLTKVDLVDDPSLAEHEVATANPGLAIIAVSTRTGIGVSSLRSQVCNRTATLIGESGAGKSSLVNALTATPEAVTGAVRTRDAKGRHTTTARSLHLVPGGGVLVDTPGIRAVGLWVDPDAVTTTFADVDELAAQCRFNDCQHDDQPGCAVRAAVESGAVAEERLVAWRALGREAAAAARRSNAREDRAHGRRFSRVARDAQRRKGRS